MHTVILRLLGDLVSAFPHMVNICISLRALLRGSGCMQAECVALKGLALPRASHSSEIALAGSRRLRSTLAAAPVLLARAVLTVVKNRTSGTPSAPRHGLPRAMLFECVFV